MVPGVAGSIPVRHPAMSVSVALVEIAWKSRCRSVAQLVEHRSPKPGVAGSIPAGPVDAVLMEAVLTEWYGGGESLSVWNAGFWRYRLGD